MSYRINVSLGVPQSDLEYATQRVVFIGIIGLLMMRKCEERPLIADIMVKLRTTKG